MNTRYKKILFMLIALIIIIISTKVVFAQEEYKIEVMYIDKILCTESNVPINLVNGKKFDQTMNDNFIKKFDDLLYSEKIGFRNNGQTFTNLNYKININKPINGNEFLAEYDYHLDADNFLYIISAFNSNIREIKGEEADISHYVPEIYNKTHLALRNATYDQNYTCYTRNANKPVLEIINIIDPNKIEEMRTTDPELSNAPITKLKNEIFKDLLKNYWEKHPDPTSIKVYRYNNYILLFDENTLGKQDYEALSYISEPIIVISTFGLYGQSLLRDNMESLKALSSISIILGELNRSYDNALNHIYKNYEETSKLSYGQRNGSNVTEITNNYNLNYTELNNLIKISESFSKEKNRISNLMQNNKNQLIFRSVLKPQLETLQQELSSFEKQIDRLIQVQANYDSFSFGIKSDIANKENLKVAIESSVSANRLAAIAIFLTVIIFLIELYMDHRKEFRHNMDILEGLLSDIEMLADASEGFKEVFVNKIYEVNNKNNKEFELNTNQRKKIIKEFNIEFLDYSNILGVYKDRKKKVRSAIADDPKIYSKIEAIIPKIVKLIPKIKAEFSKPNTAWSYFKTELANEIFIFRKFFSKKIGLFSTSDIKKKLDTLYPKIDNLYLEIDNNINSYNNIKPIDENLIELVNEIRKFSKLDKYYKNKDFKNLKIIFERYEKIKKENI